MARVAQLRRDPKIFFFDALLQLILVNKTAKFEGFISREALMTLPTTLEITPISWVAVYDPYMLVCARSPKILHLSLNYPDSTPSRATYANVDWAKIPTRPAAREP